VCQIASSISNNRVWLILHRDSNLFYHVASVFFMARALLGNAPFEKKKLLPLDFWLHLLGFSYVRTEDHISL
jgi:hypothetical protein